MTQIFAHKSLETLRAEASDESPHGEVKLNRALSMLSLIALSIGNIIGAGIFVLTGEAAAVNAGPAITLSYVVGAIVCGPACAMPSLPPQFRLPAAPTPMPMRPWASLWRGSSAGI